MSRSPIQNWTYLSHFIQEQSPFYGGQKNFKREHTRCLDCGDTSNNQLWHLANHSGTHIDLPYHFHSEGRKLEDYDAQSFIMNRPEMLELKHIMPDQIIEEADLEKLKWDRDCDFLILKTHFEEFRREEKYWLHNPGLSPELGSWLKKNCPNLKMIGFDFISLSSYQNRPLGRLAHQVFLREGTEENAILILEDMKLSSLKQKPTLVMIAPLLIDGADGSPCTVIAQLS